ncbi:hypothetical protein ACFX2F_009766 [Malus domestica]
MVEHIIIKVVDHSGISNGSPRMLRLLLAVQNHRGSLTSLVRDEVLKDVEIKVTEVMKDGSSHMAVFTISPYMMLRTTQI